MSRIAFVAMASALAVFAAGSAVGGPEAASGPPESGWAVPRAKYRVRLELVTPALTSGLNVAEAVIDTRDLALADGADVAVTDAKGRRVPCRVVADAGGGALKLRFEAAPDADFYDVYFGAGGPVEWPRKWDERPGGLTLKVGRSASRTDGFSLDRIKQAVSEMKVAHEGPRAMIDDSENPFGSNDNYLAHYEGTILAPATGDYSFAVNALDSGFVLIDGAPVAEMAGSAPRDGQSRWDGPWDRPEINYWSARFQGTARLQKGVHRITVYHSKWTGGGGGGWQLCRLGWKPPGAAAFEVVPAEAFVKVLRAREVGFEGIGKAGAEPKPRIAWTEGTTFLYNGAVALYPVEFEAVGPVAGEGELEWDFGDGSVAKGPAVLRHVYGRKGVYRVAVRSSASGAAGVVSVEGTRPKPRVVEMRVDPGPAMLAPTEPLVLEVWISNPGPETDYEIKAAAVASTGEIVPLGAGGEATLAVKRRLAKGQAIVPLGPLAVPRRGKTYVRVELSRDGVELVAATVVAAAGDAGLEGLAAADEGYVDGAGRRAVLLVSDGAWKTERVEVPHDFSRVIVLGENLGFDEADLAALRSAVARTSSAAEVRLDVGTSCLATAAEGVAELANLRLDRSTVVVLSFGSGDRRREVPLEDYRRALAFMGDYLGARAVPFVVGTGYPEPDDLRRSRAMVMEAKNVALGRGAQVVDLYSAFRLEPGGPKKFFGSGPVERSIPGPEGRRVARKRIAEVIRALTGPPRD